MALETTMNESSQHDSKSDELAQHLASVAQDLARIAELQVRLFAVDLRSLRNRLAAALGIWLAALFLLAAALPVALSSFAHYLARYAGISIEAGLLWVSMASVLLVLVLCVSGWRLLRKKQTPLDRARNELSETLKTLAGSFSNHADAPR